MNAARGAMDWFAHRRAPRAVALTVVGAMAALAGPATTHAAPLTGVDLSQYARVGRFDLPEPTRTTPPANSLLAQEASAVTYDWDTDSLFVVGDGGTSVVQVSKTGALINSMTLAQGTSPQGTEFYDTEGIAYVGGGKFVLTEERDRQANLFTYVPNTTLTRAAVQTVKLGTTVGNIGIEGLTNDPQTGGFIVVKEATPEGIFQTGIDFAAGTATNGSPTTENSTNLFDPALAGLADFSDVFALSNLTTLTGRRQEPPADPQPGVGQDRQRRPRGRGLELADDRRRRGQPADRARTSRTRASRWTTTASSTSSARRAAATSGTRSCGSTRRRPAPTRRRPA